MRSLEIEVVPGIICNYSRNWKVRTSNWVEANWAHCSLASVGITDENDAHSDGEPW